MQYLDFDIEVSAGEAGGYTVKVLRSPAGEATSTMRMPFSGLALQNNLQALQIALLRSGSTRRRVDTPESQTVQKFGQELWKALFSGDILSRFEASRGEARRQDAGMRIKLRFEAPELAVLPWEYLFDADRGDYVTLSASTPLVRYIPLPAAVTPLLVKPPLRVLGMVVSPTDLPALDVERERQRLDTALADLTRRGIVELVWMPGGTTRDLQQMLWKGPWHVFHFIGHGGFDEIRGEGLIVFLDASGKAQRVSATDLGRLLGDHDPLRLAVLNACDSATADQVDVFSSTAATLVRRGTPAVVAMQYEITDDAAIEFSRSFYEAIASGIAVDAALAEARKGIALAIPGTLEWGTPVLYMRAPDGVLFDIPPLSVEPIPMSEPRAPVVVAPEPVAAPEPPPPAPVLIASVPIVAPPPTRTAGWTRAGTSATSAGRLAVGGLALIGFVAVLFVGSAIWLGNTQGSPGSGTEEPSSSASDDTVSPSTSDGAVTPGGSDGAASPDSSDGAASPGSSDGVVIPGGSGDLVQSGILFSNGPPGDEEIYRVDPDGGDPVALTSDHPADDRWPSWSPDGSHIAFTRVIDGDGDIYVMDPDGQNLRQLTIGSDNDWAPTWSPDGQFLAFNSNRNESDKSQDDLWVVPIAGSKPTFLAGTPGWDDLSPDWSPDGSLIVFTSDRDGDGRSLYLVASTGADMRRLTFGGTIDQNPTWSPDGRFLVYSRAPASNSTLSNIVAGDPLNGVEQGLTFDPAEEGNPVYSPDGTRIAFCRRIGSDFHILVTVGSDVRDLTGSLPGNSCDPSWR